MIRLTKHFLSIGLFALVAILAFAGLAHAQGSRKDDVVFNAQGRPMAGATVRVCTSSATGQPCSPLALIYSDAALTQALANPLSTDGLGNYSFYATPGRYMIELSGPGITTKQLQNVILPSDPSSPTFTTVTTTSGISAFSLTLAGNLTVNGSTSVTGSLTVGGAPVPSTNADNQWGANQRFKGPIPYRDATTYGAVSSTQTFAATCASGSPNVTLNTAGDWANGQYISIEGCGATATVSAPTLTPLSISAISRSGNLVTATVSSTATVFAGYFVQVAGVSNSTFNGVFFTTSSGGTSITWNQTAADASSSGGTVSPAVALYEGTNPGSTAHTYNVCSVSAAGGCSAKSATLTVSNDPATLTELDYNWLYFGAGTGNGFPTGVDYYCVYRDNNFIGRAVNVPGYKDDGTVWARNTNCPATAPSAATADTLTTTVVSGAGTTSLVLAANAGTSGSGLFTFHDAVPAINAAFADVATDIPGKPNVVLPAGNYYVSRLVIDTYTLEATGSINLTTHPIRLQNAGQLNGHGASGSGTNQSYNQVRILTNNMDGILFTGGGGGNSARNVLFASGITHDILFGANSSAGGNGITLENFSGSHFSAGDCLYSDSNIIFVSIKNFQCIAASIASGAPTNRSAMYLSNVWAAGSWVDWDLEDIFFDFGDFHLDSPAPSILNGSTTQFREITIKRKKSEGGVSKGNFTVDAGCQQSPVNNVITFSYPHLEDFGDSDRAPFKGLFYAPRVGTTGCTNPSGIGGNTLFANIQGADPMVGADVSFPQDDLSVGQEISAASFADLNLLQHATRIGPARATFGSQVYFNYRNANTGTDVPAASYLIPANNDFGVSDDGPGGSCAAGVTYYFKLSQSDGVGWTKVDSTTQEHSLSTGAGSRFIGIFYGVGFGSPTFLSPKYRIWFSTTSGAYSHYVETTNQGFYDFGCPAGTVATPPTSSTAYYWKVASETGDPNWWGTSATDKLGFGKTNVAGGTNIKYLGDSAGIISADKGFHAYKSAAPTCLANEGFFWYDTTSNIWKFCNDVAAAQPVGNATITCAGTLALGTTAIGSASKTALTMACTGLLTTDNVIATFNADPTGTTGYAPSTSGMLTIVSWPTANTVNVDVINNTSSSITPSASLTLNVIGIHHP